MSRFVSVLLQVLVIAAGAARAYASPIPLANGNFETGTFGGWTTFLTPGGSTLFPPVITMFDIDGPGGLAPSQVARFTVGQTTFVSGDQQGGGLFTTFSSQAGLIEVNYRSASRNVSATDNGAGGWIRVLIDGVFAGGFDFGLIAAGATITADASTPVTVAAGTHELRFLITRPFQPGSTQQFLDNVTIEQVTVSNASVPEPMSLGLVGVGLAMLRARRWPRK
jgi:hypothetical protein